MTIFKRAKDIINANVNALFDSWEDPAKMVDEYLRKLAKDLAEVKQATAAVMSEASRANRMVTEKQAEVDRFLGLAKKALAEGKEDDARVFLNKRNQLEAELVPLQEMAQVATANEVQMRKMHDKLVQDMQALNQRKATIKANASIAKATETVHGMGKRNNTESVMAAFDRMEAKTNDRRDKAAALAKLNEEMQDEATALANQYASGGGTSLDDELNALRMEMGLATVTSVDDEIATLLYQAEN